MRTPYSLTSRWQIAASPKEVVGVLVRHKEWNIWWPGLQRVTMLKDVEGQGAQAELIWRSPMIYTLRTVITVTEYMPEQHIAFTAAGDVAGMGECIIEPGNGRQTSLIFHWNVATTRRWMNILAPLLRPIFEWNHNKVMRAGEAGLQAYIAQNKGD